MLSYRHAFHAGNHGDVLKHYVLSEVLRYMVQKDKALCFIDTHAGGGCYDLLGAWAQKNKEYEHGIGRLWRRQDLPEGLQRYVDLIRTFNPDGQLKQYPGSPLIARHWLRHQDRAILFELHNAEFKQLQEALAGEQRMHAEMRNAYQTLKAVLPPRERRGVILFDPPYERLEEYEKAAASLSEAYRRFAGGVYLLWYPVIRRVYADPMLQAVAAAGMPKTLQVELSVDREDKGGLQCSGMIIVNPPWTLRAQLSAELPYLAQHLAAGTGAGFKVNTIAGE